MMRRDVPAMRPPLAALLLAACVCAPLGNLGTLGAPRPARKVPKVEIKLSGPATVRPNQSLEATWFHAVLTNRSTEPLLLFVRDGRLMNARWDWSITDAQGQPIGMAFVNRGYCGTEPYSLEARLAALKLHDADFVSLAPGESREFDTPGGPSDDFNFPTAGTYHLRVQLTYVPPNAAYLFDERGRRWKAVGYEQWDESQLSVDAAAALRNSLGFASGKSSSHDLTLPTARPQSNAYIGPAIELSTIPNHP